jgi:hypothetical protein
LTRFVYLPLDDDAEFLLRVVCRETGFDADDIVAAMSKVKMPSIPRSLTGHSVVERSRALFGGRPNGHR